MLDAVRNPRDVRPGETRRRGRRVAFTVEHECDGQHGDDRRDDSALVAAQRTALRTASRNSSAEDAPGCGPRCAVPPDREHHRLLAQVPGRELRARPLVQVVVLVELHVDEVDLVLELRLDLLGDVGDRAADAALAQRGRGEQQDGRAVALERVGQIDLVHGVGRDAGLDLLDVAADRLDRRRVDADRAIARPRHRAVTSHRHLRDSGDQPPVQLRDRRHHVAARARERNLRDVDRSRRVRVLGAVAALELRLHLDGLVVARGTARARSRRARARRTARPRGRRSDGCRDRTGRSRTGSPRLEQAHAGSHHRALPEIWTSTRKLRPDGSREVDGGLPADPCGPEASVLSSPQPAATTVAVASARPALRRRSARASRFHGIGPRGRRCRLLTMVRGVRLPLQTQAECLRCSRGEACCGRSARTGSHAPASRSTAGAPLRPARSVNAITRGDQAALIDDRSRSPGQSSIARTNALARG